MSAGASRVVTGPVVARIPYLNSEPFYARWDAAPGPTVDLPPRALGEEASAGRADAGLMATADYFRLEPDFERVGNLGISCLGTVRSVLLLSLRPAAELAGATVALTTESATSVELTRLFLEVRLGLGGVRYERRAVETGNVPRGEAWLLIGDAALAAHARREPGVHATDLGAEWLAWTGLPFVYAVWAARTSLPAEERTRLREFLEASLAEGEASIDDIAARYAGRRLGRRSELADYLRAFRYRLGPDEERGLEHFRALREEHGSHA